MSSQFVYDFSILEPIASNTEFVKKVKPMVYSSFKSFFSLKRLFVVYAIAKFANEGKFKETGRYRIVVAVIGMKIYARLDHFV